MLSFSERYGYMNKPLQTERITNELRNRIWNIYCSDVDTCYTEWDSNYLEDIMDSFGFVVENINDGDDLKHNLETFQKWFMKAEWYKIYDFIEKYLNCLSATERKYTRKKINSVFEAENAGYRVIGNQVVPITNQNEILCIEQAQKTKYNNVNTHFKKATELFSRRPSPDYENSIKESISAVEALCCIITGESGGNATLGKTIKKLKDSGIRIHPAMESAFSSLYGYTCDENGIRHGGIDFTNAPAEDAKYMLVSCSAFVNYLLEKWSKVTSA